MTGLFGETKVTPLREGADALGIGRRGVWVIGGGGLSAHHQGIDIYMQIGDDAAGKLAFPLLDV